MPKTVSRSFLMPTLEAQLAHISVLRSGRFAKMFQPYVKLPDSEDQYGYGWFLSLGEELKQLPETGRAATTPLQTFLHRAEVFGFDGQVLVEKHDDGGQLVVEALTPRAATLLWGSVPFPNAEEKTRALLDAAKSDPRAAFARALTAEAEKYTDDYVEEWTSLAREHGGYRGYRLVGIVPRGETARAFVELQYANGTVPITYIWRQKGEGRLAGSTPGDGPPLARIFAPASDGSFLACNFASRQIVTLDPAADRLTIGGVAFRILK